MATEPKRMPLSDWLAEEAKRTGLSVSQVHYRLNYSMKYMHLRRRRIGRKTWVELPNG